MADLARIFKAYDVRGLVPDELDEPAARAIGAAFARLDTRRADPARRHRPVVVGHDMRDTSPALARAFAAGAQDAGRDVLEIGLAATDQLTSRPAAWTRPPRWSPPPTTRSAYNGLKLCLAGAVALSAATGLDEIRDEVGSGTPAGFNLIGRVARISLSYFPIEYSSLPIFDSKS